ncbi:MAG: metalloregulator ArsR/SmtB family transcription factor [Eubacteriales bacterium]
MTKRHEPRRPEGLLCSECAAHLDMVGRREVARCGKSGEAEALASLFKLLGDPTRMRVLLALAGSPLCVCDLADSLGMTASAISHQLRLLKRGGLVKSEKSGKHVCYSLDDSHVYAIIHPALEHIRE